MFQLSQFLQKGNGTLSHYCPACKEMHTFHVDKPHPITDGQWTWDGNTVEPTFTPAIRVLYLQMQDLVGMCHYSLIAGEISYFEDSTHALRGFKIHLPALPQHLRSKNELLCYKDKTPDTVNVAAFLTNERSDSSWLKA
jgi:uncharacterized protein DUF6527